MQPKRIKILITSEQTTDEKIISAINKLTRSQVRLISNKKEGAELLIAAELTNRTAVVVKLLQIGINPNIELRSGGDNVYTPFFKAVESLNPEHVKLINLPLN